MWAGIDEGTGRIEDVHTHGVILSGTRGLLPVDCDPQDRQTSACDIPNAGGRSLA